MHVIVLHQLDDAADQSEVRGRQLGGLAVARRGDEAGQRQHADAGEDHADQEQTRSRFWHVGTPNERKTLGINDAG